MGRPVPLASSAWPPSLDHRPVPASPAPALRSARLLGSSGRGPAVLPRPPRSARDLWALPPGLAQPRGPPGSVFPLTPVHIRGDVHDARGLHC